MKIFITILFITCTAFVSAQEKSTDSTQTKLSSTVILTCQGSTLPPEPLFVIDGVPQNSDKFKQLNPEDIISVSVLKNAPGSEFLCRNNNGSIIVKTKNGLTKKEKRKLKREQKKKDQIQAN
jgi:hypothetical protein